MDIFFNRICEYIFLSEISFCISNTYDTIDSEAEFVKNVQKFD